MLATNSRLVGLLYLAPTLILVAVFVFYPLAQLVSLSMTRESLLGGGAFVGFDNYVLAFNDRAFWQAFWFTIRYTLFITPVLIGAGFLLALLASIDRPIVRLTRGVVFLPVVIGLASSSLLWVWLFNQQVGLFNKLLVDLGVLEAPLVWFNRADLMLAGMQSINCPLNLLSVLFMERRSRPWDDHHQRRKRGHGTPRRSWRRAG